MIGQKLSSRYEIVGELGRGGMGVVYRARDPLLNRDVAVKLIPPSLLSPDTEHRFQREAQLVAQMDHPAIVSIYDFGRHADSLFFVMPLVQGTNLRAFLREDSVLGDVLDIGIQVAEALEYSHARGVVHRDIKPENIMVSREAGLAVRVRVMDFGLARASTESRLTKTGALVGTLSYLSPEQVAAKEVDGRADVYALGTVLYECVVSQPPFSGEAQSILYRIVHEFVQSPRSLGAAIDEELDEIILGCLAKDPAKRPQRAGELAEALKRYRSRLHDSDRTRSVLGFTRTFQAQRPTLAPFIGRTREFAELQQRLNAAVAGECQFAVVAGEPGVGKTRLLEELEKLAHARQIRVLHGRSVEQDRAFPYQGFCDLIQEHFRSKETGSSPAPDLTDLASDLVALFPMLGEIGDIRQAVTGDSKLSRGSGGPENRTQIFELLARTLTRIAGSRPLLLFLEDLHEAEVSIEALQYIVQRLGPTPTLIVGSYRSTEVDGRHPLHRMLTSFRGDRRFVLLSLGPFSPSEHRSFLETLVAGGAGLSDELAKRLFEGTEGNPFFTKELVRSLMDSGGIARDDTGAWSLSAEAGIAADALPATIQQAVEKRIERLPNELRGILSMAAVVGKSFDSRDLEALGEGKDIDDAIDRLVQEGLIEEERESRDRLAFSSGVVRDVLYAALPPRKRRSLHRRYAELVEARHAGRLDRVLPQLVHHFSQGDVAEKTVEHGLRLAQASLEAFSAEEAARSAKTALQFLDEDWQGERALEGDARALLAKAHRLAGDIDGALREAAAAIRIYEAEKQPVRALAPLRLAAEIAWQARRSEEASRWVEKGLAVARALGDTESLPQFHSLAATLANLRGEYEKANEHLEEVARLLRGAKEAEPEREIASGGTLVVALANPVRAVAPIAIRTIEEEEVLGNVFDTLLGSDEQGHVVPALCASWEMGQSGRAFLLRLRDGVRFQDGHPLQAADVKASIEEQIRESPQELPAAFAAIEGVEAFAAKAKTALDAVVVRSERELEIRLAEPLPIYPALLTHQRTAIVRSSPGGGPAPELVGTGPFRAVSRDSTRIRLERNAEYWRSGLPRLDAVEFRPSLAAAAIAKGLRSGEFDLVRDLLPADLDEILRDLRYRRGLVEAPKKNTYFVLFNSLSGGAARNAGLRRALAGVVRPRDLVWRTLGRFAAPATGLIPPGMLGHDPGRRTRPLTRDEALEALRGGGVAPPVRLRAAVHPVLLDRYASLLAALFSIWAELGVEIEVANRGMAEFLQSERENEGLDLRIGRWNADYDDPDNFTYTLFHSGVGLWRNWFSSAEADQILEEARSESRTAVREAHYRKFEGLLLEPDHIVSLFHDIDYRLASEKVRGLRLRSAAPWLNYEEVGKGESAEPVEARPAGGGILHVPIAGIVGTLDPALLGTFEQGETVPNVVETLTRDAGGARIVPWLAAEIKAEDGGRSYRFRLRDDVRFHDGRRLTARDVRYSFERLLQSRASEPRWMFSSIRGAQALLKGEARDLAGFRIQSATEFSIELEEPVAFFPALIAFQAASIVPEGSDPGSGSGPEACVGTGPFRVVSFEPGRRLELARNKNYWRRGQPRSEGLVFSFGVSPKDMLAGFREGRFSIASDLLPADVEALRREPDFASGYRETPRLSTYYAVFNTHRGPLAERSLRQRLIRAVEVPRLVRQTLGRLAVPAVSLFPPGLLGRESLSAPRAGPLESPAPEGPAAIELTATAHPIYFEGYSALARELWSAFAQAGVKVRIEKMTIDEFLEAQRSAGVDLMLSRWSADYPDADNFAYRLHSQGGNNGRLCGSAEVDRLIERGRAETAPAVRHSVYRQIEEIIARDALLLPLFHDQAYRFARPEVEGLSVSFGIPTVAYEDLCIRDSP